MSGLYVYGFAPAAGPPVELPRGIAGAQASAYRFGDVAAIVSPVEVSELRGRARDVRAHEEVLRSLLGQRDTVVPLRFGAVYKSGDMLESELLEPAESRILSLFEVLAETVEFQLRAVYLDHETILRELVSSDRGLRRLRERAQKGGYMAQVELGEAVVAAFERRRELDRQILRDCMARHARDVIEQTESSERVAAQLSFLVGRSDEKRFEAEAERCAETHSGELVLRLTGPLPPYSFVAFELETAGAR